MMYAWLNIETGKFSDSWTEEDHKKYLDDKTIEEQAKEHPEWKIIRYECINDKKFEFVHHMKLR
jgi:ketol-acid reductoisomerase